MMHPEDTLNQLARCSGLPPILMDKETRLKGAIIEACEWLRRHAEGKALDVLEKALRDTRQRE